jgi:quinol-cytochrome oxidoreductase complex cytochrome b subunit
LTSFKNNIFERFKKSIYQGSLNPKSEQDRLRLIFRSLILHLHPPTINQKVIKFNHTFGLGGMAVILICIQFITGLLLRFTYEPFPGRAYDSILHLQNSVLFGQLIRNLHHWSAVFLIIITLLHLLRVFFTGAFHGLRQFNWVLGIILFLIIIFSNFTGYLLPWDQLSYWAVIVSTSMLDYIPFIGTYLMEMVLAGKEVGNSTLLLFYNLHTGIFPILLILIMAFHFWRVRKAGGVVIPKSEKEDNTVSTVPNLVAKEFVVAIVLIAFIFSLSILFNAPLLEKANPNFSPNPAKAPWYFLGIQELMLHFHPLFSAIIIPLIIFFAAIFLPYINYETEETGIWFYSEKGKKLGITALILAVSLTIIFVLLSEYFIDFTNWFSFLPEIISNGLFPFALISVAFMLYYQYLSKNKKGNKNEIIQTLFVFLLTSLFVLTIIGIYFRGEGMALTFF